MTNKSKTFVNGIEITSKMSYLGWRPGFEYTKNFNFKNLNTKSVKISFKPPQTKYFTTLLPKVISLSPGTTFSLPLTFRPLEKIEYKDVLQLIIFDFEKTVDIPILARLPEFKIELADQINIGLSSVFDESIAIVKLKNSSELDTFFELDVKEPFNVSPTSGELKANETIHLEFRFQPKAALVYRSNCILKYGELNNLNTFKSFELSGIGKYPHILAQAENGDPKKEIILNYEKVMIGETVCQYFNLVNLTEVKTSYQIEKDSKVSPFENSFKCLQEYGVLQPFERQRIAITFSPAFSNSETIYNYFNVFSSGNLCKTRITCQATIDVPQIAIDKNLLDFGRCDLRRGESTTPSTVFRTFNLINKSQSQIAFQFETDNDFSVFNFGVTNGVLAPNETRLIQVSFRPQHPIIYYKRVFCLVQNHIVLAIDLIGSANSELVQPPEISRKNLTLFNYLREENLLNNPPEVKNLKPHFSIETLSG